MLDEHPLLRPAPTRNGIAETAAYGLPDAVVVVERDGTVAWANPAAHRMFGVAPADGIGVAGLTFVHPDDRKLCALALERCRTETAAAPLEIRMRGAEGWRLVEVVGADAEADGRLVVTIRDVTERRRTEAVANAAARCHTIIQRSAAVTIVVDGTGIVRHASDSLARFLGLDPVRAEGEPLSALVSPRDRVALTQTFERLLDPADDIRELTVDLYLRSADAGDVPFALTFTDLRADPSVASIVVSAHEISDRVMAEAQLRQANSLLTATLEATDDGVFVIDRECRVTTVNTRFAEMWDIPPAVLATGNGEAVLAAAAQLMRDPETVIARNLELFAAPDAHGRDVVEFTDGRVFELTSLPQRIDREVVGRVWSVRDVTERVRLERELAHRALHDPLTGLANTVLFRDRLTQATARLHRHSRPLAVLFIDLDCFKTVNDTFGHSTGDDLIVTVGERLAACLRESDTAARLGGDEFAVLLEDLRSPEDALLVARRILAAIRAPLLLGDRPVNTSASIGVAFGRPGSEADDLLGCADAAMYIAKAAGKNCIHPHRAP